ncbi:MAG TPA: trypsin-like peptidase domain-containing protein [Kofleriaceae bacterium]|jgi:Do/DeqQ family serine protease
MTLRSKLVAAAAVVGLTGTGFALTHGSHAYANPGPPTVLTDTTMSDVAERSVESVVNIKSVTKTDPQENPMASDPFFSDEDSPAYGDQAGIESTSLGSGVIVNSSGRILTNSHVVRGATEITVTLHDGTDVPAKVVGIDTRADLAVIQLQGKNLPTLKPLPFGDSSTLRLGEVVLAIGNPMGVGKSVSMGIISAKGVKDLGIETYEDFIQTDAAINPGNSGGALVNMKGELIGINTAIASKTGMYAGIGYAIPTAMARPIVDELVKNGHVTRGYLGVGVATSSAAIQKRFNLGSSVGAIVTGVEKTGPSASVGLDEGDVITSVNGTAVKTDRAVISMIGQMKPGVTVSMDVVTPRNGTKTVKVKLGEQPQEAMQERPTATPQRRQQRGQQQQGQSEMQRWENNGSGWRQVQ